MKTKWHLMKDEEPTIVEENPAWAWNYAIVEYVAYDCLGDSLYGYLCKPIPERRVFEGTNLEGEHCEIPYDRVKAWARLDVFEDEEG